MACWFIGVCKQEVLGLQPRAGGLRAGHEVVVVVLGGCQQEKRRAAYFQGGVEMFRAKA
jgi:hypothetical protein